MPFAAARASVPPLFFACHYNGGMTDTPSPLLTGLAPVIARDTRIIILGSFPGNASLAAQQYYAHPRNQFWKLVGALVGENLYSFPYDERLPRLLAHRFGLWDVLAACEREGSLDSAIRKPAANDFERLHKLCPELETVGFNGQASGKFAPQFEQAGYRTVVLPSSSPAHMAMSFEQKLAVWRRLLDASHDPCATARLF
jgi:hypoxanthine-DNA glycosylase